MFPDTYIGGWRSREDDRKCCFPTQKPAFDPTLLPTENQWLAEEVPIPAWWLAPCIALGFVVWLNILGAV